MDLKIGDVWRYGTEAFTDDYYVVMNVTADNVHLQRLSDHRYFDSYPLERIRMLYEHLWHRVDKSVHLGNSNETTEV